MERNLLLKIQYDGSGYHGWQVQENAQSIQGVFQEALRNVLGTQPDIKACSRTDTGLFRGCVRKLNAVIGQISQIVINL